MRRDMLLGAAALARLTSAQSTTTSSTPDTDSDALVEECYPNDASAPCVQVGIIEDICNQRGIAMSDHKSCMCDGSYFEDWNGCQSCLRVHGAFGEADVNYWTSVMGEASSSLCEGSETPTVFLNEIFASAAASAGPATGESSAFERETFASNTEVSEYYTVPEEQGPGITPTVTPQTETSGTTTTETESETETETGSGSGNDDDDDAASGLYARGAAAVAMLMAGGALFVLI